MTKKSKSTDSVTPESIVGEQKGDSSEVEVDWTEKRINKLVKAVSKYGRNWTKIQSYVSKRMSVTKMKSKCVELNLVSKMI